MGISFRWPGAPSGKHVSPGPQGAGREVPPDDCREEKDYLRSPRRSISARYRSASRFFT
jgi:hypothetical protein